DAVAKIGVENDEDIEIFAFVNPNAKAKVRKALKDELKYVEAYARAGYIGSVAGVNIYDKKDAEDGEIVVATKSEEIPAVAKLADEYGITKLSKVILGGASRGESAYLGALSCNERAKLIAVHDGARPLGSSEMIARVVELAAKTGAAVVAVPVKDTIKMMSPEGYIDHTPKRDMLRAAQTPQVFDAAILRAAYAKAMEEGIDYTDDCAAVEALGKHIYICDGENTNLKITTPEDLILAQAILEARNA
ncbi:MAG: 2-C-methyl-D-erythritol 4-phosphate cytidylyltransferase, partial [Clostridia bacterium]|nr:2-C-methyl-D-erythritol 4-phosphate cytidylyltransferase [Clostridia bacterium]